MQDCIKDEYINLYTCRFPCSAILFFHSPTFVPNFRLIFVMCKLSDIIVGRMIVRPQSCDCRQKWDAASDLHQYCIFKFIVLSTIGHS